MKCPRCQAQLNAGEADAQGLLVCSGCGARLRTRQAPPAESSGALDRLLSELEALRRGQEEILSLLRGSAPSAGASTYGAPRADSDSDEDVFSARPRPAIRSGHRKSVLVIDDDEAARAATVAALEKAQVPVAAVSDGNAALARIAEDRPDVIVLELELGGSLGGRDVVNMIKATMEWVDIPIVLHTRAPIESQKEARQVHGADELVPKRSGSEQTLVSRVIALFRKT